MSGSELQQAHIPHMPQNSEELMLENQRLLAELETAYMNMERILEESKREKAIAYSELQEKFEALENLYDQLSKKENMLIHMEKLSSIGQFITELIHELSSPLTAITLQAQLAVMKNIEEETAKQFKIVSEHAERMSNLLSRFKAMAYKGKEDFRLFDLNQNLVECVETIEIIKPKSVRIQLEVCEDNLPIKGDPYQINQIFLNLAKNAFDAMKNNGELLRIYSRKLKSKFIRETGEISQTFCQRPDEWKNILKRVSEFAVVYFNDQGSGIPEELMLEIFQPFFTTKERGKGTGLGLHISSDISLRHGGNLAVKSKVGKGTTFQLLLPIAP